MAETITDTRDRHSRTGLNILQTVLADCHPRNFAVRMWDGTVWGPEEGQRAIFTMVINRPGALRRMFWQASNLSIGEAYIYGDFDIEGNFESAFALEEYFNRQRHSAADRFFLAQNLIRLPLDDRPPAGRRFAECTGPVHSPVRDRDAVRFHYDVSNDFYALWLDRRMVYSTAYFRDPGETLDAAQERKLEYVCRKLRLRPGERLLDIGCGWGGLLIHAAKTRGAKAFGITLSLPQAELARERIRKEGLSDLCCVEVRDYREVVDTDGFDKIASIGMFEHVGETRLEEYFGHAWRLLRPGGVFLNHGIAANAYLPIHPGPYFADHYVFPDGDLLPIHITLRAAERSGFEVRDVESLREHYLLTLRHWIRRLETRYEEARLATDEVTCRIFRIYLYGAAYRFREGTTNVYQSLLVRPDEGRSGLPLTREDWYP